MLRAFSRPCCRGVSSSGVGGRSSLLSRSSFSSRASARQTPNPLTLGVRRALVPVFVLASAVPHWCAYFDQSGSCKQIYCFTGVQISTAAQNFGHSPAVQSRPAGAPLRTVSIFKYSLTECAALCHLCSNFECLYQYLFHILVDSQISSFQRYSVFYLSNATTTVFIFQLMFSSN